MEFTELAKLQSYNHSIHKIRFNDMYYTYDCSHSISFCAVQYLYGPLDILGVDDVADTVVTLLPTVIPSMKHLKWLNTKSVFTVGPIRETPGAHRASGLCTSSSRPILEIISAVIELYVVVDGLTDWWIDKIETYHLRFNYQHIFRCPWNLMYTMMRLFQYSYFSGSEPR